MDADSAARFSAWPALICYAAVVLLRNSPFAARRRLITGLWTAGCLALVIHVVVAMYAIHGGSWVAAYEHVARRTRDTVGWNWGGGVWFNLLTALIWAGDVLWTWIKPPGLRLKTNRWEWAAHVYLAFMMFNATVVFGSLPAQIFGVAICVALVVLWAWNRRGGGYA